MEEYIVRERSRQIAITSVVCAVSFLMTLYYSSLNISLGPIANYFGVKVGRVAWIPLLYLLIITSSILGFGKLGDIKGYKKVFSIGISVFAAGAALSTVAPRFSVLLLAQIVQATGEAMFSPICIAFLTVYLPSDLKGKALGFSAAFQGVGLVLGPFLGGIIISNFSWRGIFAMTIPISIAIILAALKILPFKRPVQGDARFDLPGATLLFTFLAALLYVVNSVVRVGWNNPIIMALFALSVALFVLFIYVERKSAHPLLDLELFKNLNFSLASAAAALGLALNIGFTFIFPFYLQLLRHFDISKVGLIMMSQSIMMMVFAPVAGSLSDRVGSRKVCIFGMALSTVAFVMLSFLSPQSAISYIIICLICLGSGMGFFIAPNSKLVMVSASFDKQGVASGVYKIAVNAGSSFGISLFMLVLAQVVLFDIARMNIMLSEVRRHSDIIMSGFQGAFIFGATLAIATLLFSYMAKEKSVSDDASAVTIK
jgi:EmrB/QacA subfamily drug resistance transporter